MNEELDDILSRPPKGLVRWGTLALLGICLFLLVGTRFIRYPEVCKGSIVVKFVSAKASDRARALEGEATFSIRYISKLRIGQRVNIQLNAFPVEEYGQWTGTIRELRPGLRPNECQATIAIGKGQRLVQLIEQLPFRPYLTGMAHVVVRNETLFSQLLSGLVNY
ncbi:hypothetical protein GCM10028806_25220 [Spirosoma terrae]|uniref:HlyD family secretion protein n=1 Tax=Spirosoma terrae TaxID=1968276 RepID=A0A6L9L990_9BACT|nr:hypothetical protein [Spirosoma terrae]NDU96990.1 hypothetical protein [Spirosoma terrae]